MSLPMSADMMQRSLCNCDKGGVWLCQPCGRTIRNADHDYLRCVYVHLHLRVPLSPSPPVHQYQWLANMI